MHSRKTSHGLTVWAEGYCWLFLLGCGSCVVRREHGRQGAAAGWTPAPLAWLCALGLGGRCSSFTCREYCCAVPPRRHALWYCTATHVGRCPGMQLPGMAGLANSMTTYSFTEQRMLACSRPAHDQKVMTFLHATWLWQQAGCACKRHVLYWCVCWLPSSFPAVEPSFCHSRLVGHKRLAPRLHSHTRAIKANPGLHVFA